MPFHDLLQQRCESFGLTLTWWLFVLCNKGTHGKHPHLSAILPCGLSHHFDSNQPHLAVCRIFSSPSAQQRASLPLVIYTTTTLTTLYISNALSNSNGANLWLPKILQRATYQIHTLITHTCIIGYPMKTLGTYTQQTLYWAHHVSTGLDLLLPSELP